MAFFEFELDPAMMEDIILRQAGTLEKAVLEAAMNSAEAGATKFDITFVEQDGKYILRMKDNGRGIDTEDKLIRYFRRFGTRHSQSENKVWAKFRVGRGQCFAQGKNTWRTHKFVMKTDVIDDIQAGRLPRYEMISGDHVDGCEIEIELYSNRWYGSIDRLRDSVKTQIEFMSMDVFFNGEKLSRCPESLSWTFEDDFAYYLFGAGSNVVIYNLGVRCQTIPASTAGCVGIIVSKQLFDVNFARNEILTSCPVFQHVQEVIKLHRVKKSRAPQKRLDKDERTATLSSLRYGELNLSEMMNTGLLYTTSGRSLTLRDVANCRIPWSFGEEGDRLADRLMQGGQALVVDRSVISRLGYVGDESKFFSWLTKDENKMSLAENLYKPLEVLKGRYSNNSFFIPRQDWTRLERRLVRVLEGLGCWNGRSMVIATSDTVDGYTDGKTYIAINRAYISKLGTLSSTRTASSLFALLIHELAHDENTMGSHVHGEEFYRAFHDIVNYGDNPYQHLGLFVSRMKDEKYYDHTRDVIAKENKQKEKLEKKLTGVASAVTTSAAARRGRPRRRMPAGAE